MMKIEKINENFCICDQVTTNGLQTLVESDVQVIICNRSDGEVTNQHLQK